jgi:hypothetical protein
MGHLDQPGFIGYLDVSPKLEVDIPNSGMSLIIEAGEQFSPTHIASQHPGLPFVFPELVEVEL